LSKAIIVKDCLEDKFIIIIAVLYHENNLKKGLSHRVSSGQQFY